MTTVLSRVDTTTNEYRKSAVRWARRALQPGAAVILGIETTTPEAGAIAGRVGYSNLLNRARSSRVSVSTRESCKWAEPVLPTWVANGGVRAVVVCTSCVLPTPAGHFVRSRMSHDRLFV